jgi:exosortase
MVAPPVPRTSTPWAELAQGASLRTLLPWLVAAVAFVALYAEPAGLVARDWWTNPDAGHGLLLFPVSLWLAWKAGVTDRAAAQPVLGAIVVGAAVLLRYFSALAAERYTMKLSIVLTLAGLVVFAWGVRQVRHWWLPFALLVLAVPLPALITNALAVPLQLQASELGTALIEARGIPVRTTGNVITVPGQRLFVAEACSGLRSLTSLLSLGVLIGGVWLRTIPGRVAIILLAVPVAIGINAVRIFLTAFLVVFVSPEMGRGFMHTSEGWLMFLVAFALLGALAWVVVAAEGFWLRRRADG